MKRTIYDDGFRGYLFEHLRIAGNEGIPELLCQNRIVIPKKLCPFDKCRKKEDPDAYVHFFLKDKSFACVFSNLNRYIPIFQRFGGVLCPDPSILLGQSRTLQQFNVFMSRAVGRRLQIEGISVIPTIRWAEEETYSFCFSGVPKHSVVAIGSHGCLKDKELRSVFVKGLSKMLEVLEPRDVLVYGSMPGEVFAPFMDKTRFHQFHSDIETIHQGGNNNGKR